MGVVIIFTTPKPHPIDKSGGKEILMFFLPKVTHHL
jgi:hypothetical protein